MSELNDRMIRKEFWGDSDVLAWPAKKRLCYIGIWALAQQTGVLEDDVWDWKMTLWRSTEDADVTLAVLEQWRAEMIEQGKLVPFSEEDDGDYLFVAHFHDHQQLINPAKPGPSNHPLPAWLSWEPNEKDPRKGHYAVNKRSMKAALRKALSGEKSSATPTQGVDDALGTPTQQVDEPLGIRQVGVRCPEVEEEVEEEGEGSVSSNANALLLTGDPSQKSDGPPPTDLGDEQVAWGKSPDQIPFKVPAPTKANEILAEGIDYARDRGLPWPAKKSGQWAAGISQALASNATPDAIQKAVRYAVEHNLSPTVDLVWVVGDYARGREPGRGRSNPGATLDAGRSRDGEF